MALSWHSLSLTSLPKLTYVFRIPLWTGTATLPHHWAENRAELNNIYTPHTLHIFYIDILPCICFKWIWFKGTRRRKKFDKSYFSIWKENPNNSFESQNFFGLEQNILVKKDFVGQRIFCHQYLSCSRPDFNQTLDVGLWNQQQQQYSIYYWPDFDQTLMEGFWDKTTTKK